MASQKQYKNMGDDLWKNRTEKVNAELFTLTYGALVVQLINDFEDYAEVNRQLDKMGYNMGTRLIEDFLARTSLPRCADFRETAEVIAKVGFKTFLNITPALSFPPAPTSAPPASLNPPLPYPSEFILTLDENPLAEFAELPADARGGGKGKGGEGLWFSNVLCGVLRGCLEMIQMQTEVTFVSDVLRGDETTEIRVRLIRMMEEEQPVNDE